MPPTRRVTYGHAQRDFIAHVRGKIDRNGAEFLKEQNWRKIKPPGGRNAFGINNKKVTAESFYVKALAVFVPHLLIPGHVPTCPHCEKATHVDVTGKHVRWINSPKLLFGVRSHSYLDTKLYYCHRCSKRFAGYDKKSMQ